MQYPIAERFCAPQGEGLYTGTPMAFIRFVGCSVGKSICTHCDTDFDKIYSERGGGLYTETQLAGWVNNYLHICLTGGEPLDRDLYPLASKLFEGNVEKIHVETSGTKPIPKWIQEQESWLTVSPKPGYLQEAINAADEIKVILNGLGAGPGWPTLDDARRWAAEGRLVYIQPRNFNSVVDEQAMDEAVQLISIYPELRLSAQLHKYLRTR
jgi:7-carboxy-7-deazaguanine synthase